MRLLLGRRKGLAELVRRDKLPHEVALQHVSDLRVGPSEDYPENGLGTRIMSREWKRLTARGDGDEVRRRQGGTAKLHCGILRPAPRASTTKHPKSTDVPCVLANGLIELATVDQIKHWICRGGLNGTVFTQETDARTCMRYDLCRRCARYMLWGVSVSWCCSVASAPNSNNDCIYCVLLLFYIPPLASRKFVETPLSSALVVVDVEDVLLVLPAEARVVAGSCIHAGGGRSG